MMNSLKTTMLLAALTALVVAFGYYYGGREGMFVAFAVAALMNFVSFWFSDKIVLSMYHARRIDACDAPRLYGIVEKLANKAGLPMPKVYIIPTDTPNAFATGRSPSHASVAATEGIMRLLSADELEGVMAHELAHVKHRDILTGTIAATLGGAISMLARVFMYGGDRGRNRSGGGGIGVLLMVILAPIAAMLIQMAVSRSREYAADAAGARICGKPNALADALNRLQSGVKAAPMDDMGDPATSHLFIVNPFKSGFITGLFSTHPPTEERVRRLREMRRERF
jgi:heat shock protein HtpX